MQQAFTLQPGQDVASDLPPVDLPRVDWGFGPAPERPRIQIARQAPPPPDTPGTPGGQPPPPLTPPAPAGAPQAGSNDWFAPGPPPPPQQQQAPGGAPPPANDWFAPGAPPPPAEQPVHRQMGRGESAAIGAVDTATFGTAPIMQGLQQAGTAGMNEGAAKAIEATSPGTAMAMGAGRVAYEQAVKPLLDWVTGQGPHPSETPATEAFHKGRKEMSGDIEAAQEQHPGYYIAGALPAAVAMPMGAAKGGVEAASLAGMTVGGLHAGGTALSKGKNASGVAEEAGKGAFTGGVFGLGGSAIASGLGAAGQKVMSIIRGKRNPDTEAASRVYSTTSGDLAKYGSPIDREAQRAGEIAGTPVHIVDVGGEPTRATARSAANTSAEARQALEEVIQPRFEQQSHRISNFIRRWAGGGAHETQEAINQAGRAANRPAYQRAYRAGDREIWSREGEIPAGATSLERLTSAPSVVDAMRGAVAKWKDWQVLDGFGAANPPVRIGNGGILTFEQGGGLRTFPNIQFWDYTARNLAGWAEKARRAGDNQEAARLGGLERMLKAELDRLVPEFGVARRGAHEFFGAENASEAGQNFVMKAASIAEARAALGRMTPQERELFAQGFASDLADKIHAINYNVNVLDSVFLKNGAAKQKIELALGPERARELEALLRIEGVVDRARKSVFGNSKTAQYLSELGRAGGHTAGAGVAGAGAVGTYEAVKEHDFNPAHIIMAAITFGAVHKGLGKIDQNTARRVGELLASDDPRLLQRGVQVVSNSPVYMKALRLFSLAASRSAEQAIGPDNALAGGAAIATKALTTGEQAHHPSHHDNNQTQPPQQ